MDCSFLVPCDLPGPSGGTIYNNAVISALRGAGHRVHVHDVPGTWPRPTGQDRMTLETALAAHPLAVVDGIIALAAADEIAAAARIGVRVHVLIHSLLTADSSLGVDEHARFAAAECAAIRAAASVSVSSHWSARDVTLRCPGARPRVVRPGTSPAPLAEGSEPPHLLVLAALTPVKNQLLLLTGLQKVMDLKWSLVLAGSDSVDPGYAMQLRRIAADHFAPGRVTFAGALMGSALEDVWRATNLLLLTSTTETFGMVVTEALARAIPAVVPARTGAVEALLGADAHDDELPLGMTHPGAIVDPRDASELAVTLRRWLLAPELQSAWRASALVRRSRLQTWTQTAAELARILQA